MNAPIWIPWILVGLLAVISVILLTGNCSFLIAGYNTSTKEAKERIDETKLCRVVGSCTSILSVIWAVATYYQFEMPATISWIIPWGMFAVVIVMEILTNTICYKKSI